MIKHHNYRASQHHLNLKCIVIVQTQLQSFTVGVSTAVFFCQTEIKILKRQGQGNITGFLLTN
jgi:hypothetical protein